MGGWGGGMKTRYLLTGPRLLGTQQDKQQGKILVVSYNDCAIYLDVLKLGMIIEDVKRNILSLRPNFKKNKP